MKKVYLDQTNATMCVGVYLKDAQIIPAGATISSMSVRHKNSEYERYAEEYDIHFIFDDAIPTLDFYTIPQVDIFATDSRGGYIGSLGAMADLDGKAPICYIDAQKHCYRIAENAHTFLEHVENWHQLLTPCDDVELYASLVEAAKKYEFLDRASVEQSLREVKP